jgi:uncharacterized protein (TIGR02300 family)
LTEGENSGSKWAELPQFKWRIALATATADKKGMKRICPGCSTRYYDFNKRPVICPNCKMEFTAEIKTKVRRRSAANDIEESQVSENTAAEKGNTEEDEDEILEGDEAVVSLDEVDDGDDDDVEDDAIEIEEDENLEDDDEDFDDDEDDDEEPVEDVEEEDEKPKKKR